MPEQNGPTVTLYKCVDQDMMSRHKAHYPVGETVVDDAYENHQECGNGLHFWPSVEIAKHNANYGRIVIECEVDLATLVAIETDKCKARSCRVVRIVENNYPPTEDES